MPILATEGDKLTKLQQEFVKASLTGPLAQRKAGSEILAANQVITNAQKVLADYKKNLINDPEFQVLLNQKNLSQKTKTNREMYAEYENAKIAFNKERKKDDKRLADAREAYRKALKNLEKISKQADKGSPKYNAAYQAAEREVNDKRKILEEIIDSIVKKEEDLNNMLEELEIPLKVIDTIKIFHQITLFEKMMSYDSTFASVASLREKIFSAAGADIGYKTFAQILSLGDKPEIVKLQERLNEINGIIKQSDQVLQELVTLNHEQTSEAKLSTGSNMSSIALALADREGTVTPSEILEGNLATQGHGADVDSSLHQTPAQFSEATPTPQMGGTPDDKAPIRRIKG